MTSTLRRALLTACAALALVVTIAFATWVWPTAYRELPRPLGRTALALREHRVSGRVDALTAHGWVALTPADTTDPYADLVAVQRPPLHLALASVLLIALGASITYVSMRARSTRRNSA